jgi:hypothetical protein
MNTLAYVEGLRDRGSLLPAEFLPFTYLFLRQTPAHSFVTVIAPVLDGRNFLLLTARDIFDEKLAKRVIEFVSERQTLLDLSITIRILEGFCHPGYSFDTVVVLGPEAHRKFQVENKSLHARSFEVFPAFRCEFTGSESADLIDEVRHVCVDTLDWKRSPSPQVYIRFQNARTKAGTIGAKWVLTKIDPIFHELQVLTDHAGSFVELMNYKGQTCRLIVKGENYLANSPQADHDVLIPRDQIKSWVEHFLVEGNNLRDVP